MEGDARLVLLERPLAPTAATARLDCDAQVGEVLDAQDSPAIRVEHALLDLMLVEGNHLRTVLRFEAHAHVRGWVPVLIQDLDLREAALRFPQPDPGRPRHSELHLLGRVDEAGLDQLRLELACRAIVEASLTIRMLKTQGTTPVETSAGGG